MTVTDGNGVRTLDIDSFGRVKIDASEIKIASKSIETIISDADKKLEAQITLTAQQLTTSFTNADKGLQSQITQNANAITSKVSAGDVGTIVTQNATSWGLSINGKLSGTTYAFDGTNFSIGSTSTANKAFHNNNYSRWQHSDGTYTQASSQGLIWSGNNHKYLFTTVCGSVQVTSSATVSLPSNISGKIGTGYGVSLSCRGYGFDNWANTATQQIYMWISNKTSTQFTINVVLYGLNITNNTQVIGGWVNVDYVITG